MINKDGLLVSCNFNSVQPSAEANEDNKWPAIEAPYPFKKYMNDAVCELFNSGRRDFLIRSAFLTVQ